MRGLRVAFHAPNSAELVDALRRSLDAAEVPVLAHPRWPEEMARRALERAGAGRVLDVEDAATVLFTSGSTGEPKAVVHSRAAHRASAAASAARVRFGAGDRWLLSLPLCHVGGLSLLFRAEHGGGALAIPEAGEPLLDAIERLRPTHLSLVATQLRRLLGEARGLRALQRVDEILLGGGPFDDALLRRAVEAELQVRQTWGSTEMASQVCTSERGAPFTCGPPLPGLEVRIDDAGELHARGPSRFLGYLEGDALERPFDSAGWWATGDLGAWRDGGLVVEGRRDNRFISGGENVQPEAIERAFAERGRELYVVPVDDEEFGARPVAFVRGSLEGLDAIARAALPGFLRPVAWLPLPDEAGLKPRRAELRALARRLVP